MSNIKTMTVSYKAFIAIKKIATKVYFTTAVLMLVLLSGCSTMATKNPVDPWESWNRSIFNFNDSLDTGIVQPVATAYTTVMPSFVRTGVNNFFTNLTGVWTVVNTTLQLKPKAAAETFFRVTINTFLGLGGLLDIASEMNIERHTADFGQTLGHYGVPPGPYLVIPLLGSSTLRDTLASTLISRGDLVWQLKSVATRNSLYALRLLDTRANLLRSTSVLEAVALDKYSFTRDIYLQIRRNDILDGKEPPEDPADMPEFKENAPAAVPVAPNSSSYFPELPADKPKVEMEKTSELQRNMPNELTSKVPIDAALVTVSEPLVANSLDNKPEAKPETSSVVSTTAVMDAH
jgi:phospholipid-binding lipoprotein MlaA